MVVSTPMAVDDSKPKKKVRRGGVKHKSKTLPQKSVADDSEMTLEPLDSEVPETAPEQRWENEDDGDDEIMIDNDAIVAPQDAPSFPPLSANAQRGPTKSEIRRIPIPPHRMTPLKKDWVNIFSPLAELCGLQVRMNTQRRAVEIRTSKHSKEVSALQKGADFVKAYALGFDVNDAIALLRMDDLYLDSFEIKDVKTLHGDHLARAIGRIAGQDGRTKFTIENASRTRVVLADTKIHILGSFQNIKIARDAIVSLILGSPPGKVYAGLRTVGSRLRQRAM
ncbi:eukaryotic type KH-domain (KH-domain type I) [Sistotremastrum suecicum HHB10207 ss-3]|uniref:Pre-rRNA-processing protein PNO1 n=1 Tax=Sistotremastrum suecicum HHB10207 ss-3 TaxID=1314776 RepID=A0A166EKC6_9AGAM|nr:eukaryotic type KH-domain (KH-domain type I) [Sistotremastrum suecicum HHB10207 ss-3]